MFGSFSTYFVTLLAAASTAANAAATSKNPVYTGLGTRYGDSDGCTEEDCWQKGACSFVGYDLPAGIDGSTCVSEDIWKDGANCGGCIQVSYKGKSLKIMVSLSTYSVKILGCLTGLGHQQDWWRQEPSRHDPFHLEQTHQRHDRRRCRRHQVEVDCLPSQVPSPGPHARWRLQVLVRRYHREHHPPRQGRRRQQRQRQDLEGHLSQGPQHVDPQGHAAQRHCLGPRHQRQQQEGHRQERCPQVWSRHQGYLQLLRVLGSVVEWRQG